MVKSAFLTQIMQYLHVEYSGSLDTFECGWYALSSFERIVFEDHIAKTHWDS